MKRRTPGAACLIGIVLTATARVQGADEGVLLRYHFQPGQEYRYRITMSGDMATSIGGIAAPGGAALPGKIPSTMNGTYELVQKVKSVLPEGVATVSVAMDKMELTTAVMGINLVARLGAGGKLETLMNGQPAPFPNMPNTALPNPLYEIKIDPAGKVTRAAPDASNAMSGLFGGQNMSAMFNSDMPGMGMVLLPEKPVKPGDTWDTQRDVQVPIAMAMPGLTGGGPGGPPAGLSLSLRTSIHNKLLRVENGRAVIETQATASTPPGAKTPSGGGAAAPSGPGLTFEKMDQSMSGRERLNIEQGVIEDADNEIKLAMVMSMGLPAGLPGVGPGVKPGSNTETAPAKKPVPATVAAAPAAGPTSLKIGVDGTIKMKIERVHTPAAAPAGPAPPAASAP